MKKSYSIQMDNVSIFEDEDTLTLVYSWYGDIIMIQHGKEPMLYIVGHIHTMC